ncbi:MAG: plasmid stabilization protein [Kribbellaceae bacterium]|nr:plasmid stabilization protein [Kribbellaceae bacterium]
MSQDSLGGKLERQVEKLKDGLKDVTERLTAEDPDPRTPGMAGHITTAGRARKRTPSRTRDELYADAKRLGIKGRSKMTKSQLEKALHRG